MAITKWLWSEELKELRCLSVEQRRLKDLRDRDANGDIRSRVFAQMFDNRNRINYLHQVMGHKQSRQQHLGIRLEYIRPELNVIYKNLDSLKKVFG